MFDVTEPINAPPSPTPNRLSGARRAVATVLLTAGLFAVGGTAVALAADPSASPAPSNPTQPSNGGSGAPSTRPNHANGQDCPNMGGSGGSSGGSSTSPAAPGAGATPSV